MSSLLYNAHASFGVDLISVSSIKLAKKFADNGEKYYSPEVMRIHAVVHAAEYQPSNHLLASAFIDANQRGLKNLALRAAISAYEFAMIDKKLHELTSLAKQLEAALTSVQQSSDTADVGKAIDLLRSPIQNNIIPFPKRA